MATDIATTPTSVGECSCAPTAPLDLSAAMDAEFDRIHALRATLADRVEADIALDRNA